MPRTKNRIITSDILGMAFEPEQRFENPDGTGIVMDKDYHGRSRGAVPFAGPFSDSAILEL